MNATPAFCSASVAGVDLAILGLCRPRESGDPQPLPFRSAAAYGSRASLALARDDSQSIRIFREQRIDRAVPLVEILLEQLLGRRDAARDALFQRPQVTRFVAAVAVEALALLQAAPREAQRLLRQSEHVDLADLGAEAALRHFVAQLLPLLRGPVLDDLPARVERLVV